MNILLVEDDPVHARLIRKAFGEDRTCHIELITDGEAALHRLFEAHDERTDLVLIDLKLPTINGFDVIRALRGNRHTRSLPVIVVSTSSRREDVVRSYQLGANAYVSKSADYDQLTDKLRTLRRFWADAAELPQRDRLSVNPDEASAADLL